MITEDLDFGERAAIALAETVHADQASSSEAKIALFRPLFRGRDDVYPRRFESRETGVAAVTPEVRALADAEAAGRLPRHLAMAVTRAIESPRARSRPGCTGAANIAVAPWNEQ